MNMIDITLKGPASFSFPCYFVVSIDFKVGIVFLKTKSIGIILILFL